MRSIHRWMVAATVAVAMAGGTEAPALAAPTDQPVLWLGSGGADVTSWDGSIWTPFPSGTVAGKLSAPAVVTLDEQTTGMWFCSRSGTNAPLIGFKRSFDGGAVWQNGTSFSLFPSESDRDRLGVCNPTVVRAGQYFYLVYQGEYPVGQSRLFVARANADTAAASRWTTWRWEKWTGSGWQWNGDPQDLNTRTLNATHPSLAVVNGTIHLFFTETPDPFANRNLRVVSAPAGESWPSQLSTTRFLLEQPRKLDGLEVKWNDAAKAFVAVGVDRTGSVSGYRADPVTGQFRPALLDPIDPQELAVSDIALHGDARGYLGSFATYQVPVSGTTVKLRRAGFSDGLLPTGPFADNFDNTARWFLQSDVSGGWKPESGWLAFDPTLRAHGEAVARVWAGDGLYRVDMHGEASSIGYNTVSLSGLQIARQRVAGRYNDSGYTVIMKNNALTIVKGGPDGFEDSAQPMSSWPFIQNGEDPGNFTLNVLKHGIYVDYWPSWPGNPNTAHKYGGTLIEDVPGMGWGPGHMSLVVKHEDVVAGAGTWFANASFTPLG